MIPVLASTELEWLAALIERFGWQGAMIIIIGYTARRFFFWLTGLWKEKCWPLVEAAAKAHIDRQNTMCVQQEKLTSASIEIQKDNAATLKAIEAKQ